MSRSVGEKIFSFVNILLLGLIGFAALYPLLYILSASISSSDAVISGRVLLWPQELTLESYKKVVFQQGIWVAYGNTVFYTLVGTAVNLLFTILGAYPLSKKRLRGRVAVSFMISFTMLFSAGMIPFYLNLRDFGLVNTRTAMIIAFAISTWLVILLRTFFQSIPEEMEESAKIDGASDYQVLSRIYMPLALPALSTIGLFYAVGRWNGYFWAMVLLRDEDKIPLQVLLKKLIVEMNPSDEMLQTTDMMLVSQETVIYATIIVSILPMVAVYPFIQKFFVKGIMVGSLKG